MPTFLETLEAKQMIPSPKSPWNDFPALIVEARQKLGDRAKLFRCDGRSGAFFDEQYFKKQTIPWLTPWNKLAEFADIVVTAWPDATFQQCSDELVRISHMGSWGVNLSAWGNVAYIAINAIMPETRNTAAKLLTKWCKEAKEQNQKWVDELDRIANLNEGRKPN